MKNKRYVCITLLTFRVFHLRVKIYTYRISCDKIEDIVISSKIFVCVMKSILVILAIEALWGERSLHINICLNNLKTFVLFSKYGHWTVSCDVNSETETSFETRKSSGGNCVLRDGKVSSLLIMFSIWKNQMPNETVKMLRRKSKVRFCAFREFLP
jgi:hypothetical protein